MKVVIICVLCVVAYIGIVLAFYAVLNWFDPEIGLRDKNRRIAGLWPVSIPVTIFWVVVYAVDNLMDVIKEYQDRRRANDPNHHQRR